MNTLTFLAMAAGLAMTACAPQSAPEDTGVAADNAQAANENERNVERFKEALESCDASAASELIGMQLTDELRERALALAGAEMLRVIAPGTVVTMDYRTDRLNVMTDEEGAITGFRCG